MELLSSNKKRVYIFMNGIEIDTSLPKYSGVNINETEEKETKEIISVGELKEYLGDKDSSSFNLKIRKELIKRIKKEIPKENVFEMFNITEENKKPESKVVKFIKDVLSIFGIYAYTIPKENNKNQSEYTLNLLDVFKNIKIKSSEKKVFIDRLKQYKDLMDRAKSLGQVAQEEKLIEGLVTHVYESILFSAGILKYIDEDDLIKLQSKCERQLNLDYIKNFIRVIPDEVAEKKILADKLMVFDNYVILHYDPEKKYTSKTEKEEKEEIERIKKDPILFGVIRGSNKLYYIADWVDELCDLTLDKVIEKIGKVKELK